MSLCCVPLVRRWGYGLALGEGYRPVALPAWSAATSQCVRARPTPRSSQTTPMTACDRSAMDATRICQPSDSDASAITCERASRGARVDTPMWPGPLATDEVRSASPGSPPRPPGEAGPHPRYRRDGTGSFRMSVIRIGRRQDETWRLSGSEGSACFGRDEILHGDSDHGVGRGHLAAGNSAQRSSISVPRVASAGSDTCVATRAPRPGDPMIVRVGMCTVSVRLLDVQSRRWGLTPPAFRPAFEAGR